MKNKKEIIVNNDVKDFSHNDYQFTLINDHRGIRIGMWTGPKSGADLNELARYSEALVKLIEFAKSIN